MQSCRPDASAPVATLLRARVAHLGSRFRESQAPDFGPPPDATPSTTSEALADRTPTLPPSAAPGTGSRRRPWEEQPSHRPVKESANLATRRAQELAPAACDAKNKALPVPRGSRPTPGIGPGPPKSNPNLHRVDSRATPDRPQSNTRLATTRLNTRSMLGRHRLNIGRDQTHIGRCLDSFPDSAALERI